MNIGTFLFLSMTSWLIDQECRLEKNNCFNKIIKTLDHNSYYCLQRHFTASFQFDLFRCSPKDSREQVPMHQALLFILP